MRGHIIRQYLLVTLFSAVFVSIVFWVVFSILAILTHNSEPEPFQQSEETLVIVRVFKNGKNYSFQTIDENKKVKDHYYNSEIFADVEKDKPMWVKIIKRYNSKYTTKRAEIHIHEPSEIGGGSYTERVSKSNVTLNSEVIE